MTTSNDVNGSGRGGQRRQVQSLANVVANQIRARILSGDLADGDLLPVQRDLTEEYGVGSPAMREALRILEHEGLLTIKRGNVGGAIVHRPTARTAAHTLGMLLQSDNVSLSDVAQALCHLEPLCAELCARREDRGTAVVPELRAALEDSIAAMDDDLEVIKQSRRFHEAIAVGCGNHTLAMLVGVLESLWSVQEQNWAQSASRSGSFPERSERSEALKEHARLLRLIELGDAAGAADAAREHLLTSTRYALSDQAERLVSITGVQVERSSGR